MKRNLANCIVCPKCGTKIPVKSTVGRKSYGIPFTKVCKALQVTLKGHGSPNYSAAAKWLEREDGRGISPAYVWMRVKREAEAREISREELLREVLESGDKAIRGGKS